MKRLIGNVLVFPFYLFVCLLFVLVLPIWAVAYLVFTIIEFIEGWAINVRD